MVADLAELRAQLAARVGTGNPAIESALRTVPRHMFVPGVPPEEAYQDEAIVTKRDDAGVPVSSSSQPAIMAIMLNQLNLAPGQRVLEIGAGTGYNAALISHIVGPDGQVTSIDIDSEVTLGASEHLAAAGYQAVTVVTADGAAGFPAHAPYDRLIATVGVGDLAPAWLSQVGPDGLIVVPLDVRGAQLSVAFKRRDGPGGGEHWASRSIAPCGFMRMRGALADTNAAVPVAPGLRLMLRDSGIIPDAAALAAALAAPPAAAEPTGFTALAPQVFWGLNLWLAVREPLACEVTEELKPDRKPVLSGLPKWTKSFHGTYGIVADDGIALLLYPDADHELVAAGYGPSAATLADRLTTQVRAWHAAGRPATQGLHVDAYPRDAAVPPIPGAMIVERPNTRLAVYHA